MRSSPGWTRSISTSHTLAPGLSFSYQGSSQNFPSFLGGTTTPSGKLFFCVDVSNLHSISIRFAAGLQTSEGSTSTGLMETRGYLLATLAHNKGEEKSIPEQWVKLVRSLERPASSSLEAFLLPVDDPRIQAARQVCHTRGHCNRDLVS